MWPGSSHQADKVGERPYGGLIAVGYPDETTALATMDEAERLQKELGIQADAVAAIVRNKEGKLRVVFSAV